MLDFFRDLYLESHGIDSKEAEKERQMKRQQKREKYILFTGKTKAVLIAMAVLFVIMQSFQIPVVFERGIGFLIADISLCIIAIVAAVLLLIRRKKTEIAAAILIAIFAVAEYCYMLSFILL